ncbi:LysM domain-containing protein [Patescibacteria group bacterium]|nr:LysM domain-containing protein [Patescibacteria group bacterium]
MVRVRISQPDKKPAKKAQLPKKKNPAAKHPGYTPDEGKRGLTERQWFLGLLTVAGLLMLFTFRGCILPSGVGPKGPTHLQASSAPTASTAPAGGEYTVQSGDTLSEIASKNGTTVDALAEANGIDLNQRIILRVGQKLKIPSQ